MTFRLSTKDEKKPTREEYLRPKETSEKAEEGLGSLTWVPVRAKQGTQSLCTQAQVIVYLRRVGVLVFILLL